MTEDRLQAVYDAAVQVQRQHEAKWMHLPGVNAVATKLLNDGVAIVISADPAVPVAHELAHLRHVEGVRVVVERERYVDQLDVVQNHQMRLSIGGQVGSVPYD